MRNSPAARQAALPLYNDSARNQADYAVGLMDEAVKQLTALIAGMAVAYCGEAMDILIDARSDIQGLHRDTEEEVTLYDSATTTGETAV